MNTNSLYPTVKNYIDLLDIDTIADDRKLILNVLRDYIQKKLKAEEAINLNFICTHNSRRSQFSQVWAAIFSDLNQIGASCHSGGVEVTACNERVINTFRSIGLEVSGENDETQENPHYLITYREEGNLIILFSKLFDDDSSPKENMCAVMVCSHADENCPYIPAADARIPLRYEDPKAFDDTDKEKSKYLERCQQIATEMKYIFSSITTAS